MEADARRLSFPKAAAAKRAPLLSEAGGRRIMALMGQTLWVRLAFMVSFRFHYRLA